MQNKHLARKTLHRISVGQLFTFDEAVQYLYDGLPVSTKATFRGGAGLQRAKHFYKMLGSPHEQHKSIHIAGTSGKGSVAHIMTHLLKEHGFTVGTFISPHVYDIRERVRINGEMISRMEFAEVTSEVISYILKMQQSRHGPATFFEVMTGIAYRVFANHEVDYMVIETGLGGLYDSTNTIERSDKIAVVSALGLDHTEILGETLPEIALQKAGIFPHEGQAVAWEPADGNVRKVIDEAAGNRSTELDFANRELYTLHSTNADGITFDYHSKTLTIQNLKLSMYGEHQAQNTALSLRTLELLSKRDGFEINPDSVRRALSGISIPGRFERVTQGNRQIVFDGAHNPQKMQAFVDALKATGIKQADWVLALKQSKDIEGVLKIVAPYVNTLYATVFLDSHKDMALFNAIPADELAGLAKKVGIAHVEAVPDCRDAFELAYTRDQELPIVVSGSFYLVGDLGRQRISSIA